MKYIIMFPNPDKLAQWIEAFVKDRARQEQLMLEGIDSAKRNNGHLAIEVTEDEINATIKAMKRQALIDSVSKNLN
jgi:hypothetical protein